MARVDSGHETLFSDEEDSPTPTCESRNSGTFDANCRIQENTTSAWHYGEINRTPTKRPNAPPKLTPVSGVLGQGKVVIRPIAFKPVVSPAVRYPTNGSEKYCSTPSLPRLASQATRYGSTSDLRPHGSSSSSFLLDRKLSQHQTGNFHYHSTENVNPVSLSSYHPYHHLQPDDKYANVAPDVAFDPDDARFPRSYLATNIANMQRIGGSMTSMTRLASDRNGSSVGGSSLHLDRLTGMTSMSTSGSQLNLEDLRQQTPSPSDSGVAELEAMLKEKDSEINYLRETMEQNEQVIFKVYEEKEKMWERELRKIKGMYENRLKASQQKALKMEQMLMMQTYQLQQEKRKLHQEMEEGRHRREQAERRSTELQREVEALRLQLEETEWSLCQKSGEISLLKSQLKDSQGDQTTKGHEMLHLRGQVREYKAELERKEQEFKNVQDQIGSVRKENSDLKSRLGDLGDDSESVDSAELGRLRSELESVKADRETLRDAFEEERVTWLEEKEKVIRYQKQLQLNYVHMYRRTRSLEAELESNAKKGTLRTANTQTVTD